MKTLTKVEVISPEFCKVFYRIFDDAVSLQSSFETVEFTMRLQDFRVFWIDFDHEEIVILNNKDWTAFLSVAGINPKRKIHLIHKTILKNYFSCQEVLREFRRDKLKMLREGFQTGEFDRFSRYGSIASVTTTSYDNKTGSFVSIQEEVNTEPVSLIKTSSDLVKLASNLSDSLSSIALDINALEQQNIVGNVGVETNKKSPPTQFFVPIVRHQPVKYTTTDRKSIIKNQTVALSSRINNYLRPLRNAKRRGSFSEVISVSSDAPKIINKPRNLLRCTSSFRNALSSSLSSGEF